jgi:hypothetical protein
MAEHMRLFDRYSNTLLGVSQQSHLDPRHVWCPRWGRQSSSGAVPQKRLPLRIRSVDHDRGTEKPQNDLMGQPPVAEPEVRVSRMIATLWYLFSHDSISSHDYRHSLMPILYELRTLFMGFKWEDALNPTVVNLSVMIFI